MTRTFQYELPPGLAAAVDALQAPPSAADEQRARRRLRARLDGARKASRAPIGWWATAAASVLAMVLVAMPLLSNQGRAFADVQAHFRDFRTLSMRVEQRADGRVLQTSRMVVDQQGVLRTDVGDMLSVIVDPVHERVLMLQHGPRAAMSFPLDPAGQPAQDELGWLEKIRDFKGKARRLEETRVIDGREAHGWALEAEGVPMVLWVGDDGLPLAMESEGGDGLSLQYRFEFDVALPAGYLSSEVPDGYALAEPDPH